MKILLAPLLLIIYCSFIQAGDWILVDRVLFAISTLLLVVDYAQTRYIAVNPDRFHELNIILGKHPSIGAVNVYFTLVIFVSYFVADYMSSPWYRVAYLGAVTVLEMVVVIRNKRLGIGLTF